MGTSTLDVEVRPHRDRARTSTLDANAQASLPIVDVMLPSGRRDHLTIPQINLSILGYEPDSLRNSHIRSPSMQTQEISILLQLDGLTSLPMRDPCWKKNTGRPQASRARIFPWRYICTRNLHIKKEGISRGSDDDDYRRSCRDRRPPERGRYPNQGGNPRPRRIP